MQATVFLLFCIARTSNSKADGTQDDKEDKGEMYK